MADWITKFELRGWLESRGGVRFLISCKLGFTGKASPERAALGDALFRVYYVFNNFRIMYDADFWEAKIFRLVFIVTIGAALTGEFRIQELKQIFCWKTNPWSEMKFFTSAGSIDNHPRSPFCDS
jgi:hypothetical protein